MGKEVNILFLKAPSFLPSVMKSLIKKSLFKLILNYKFLCSLYYAFLPKYVSEQMIVLQGIKKYHREVNDRYRSYAYFVKNIHKIEKGLSARNRKPVFAISFIQETVYSFKFFLLSFSSEKVSTVDKTQLKWAADVLDKYFEVVEYTDEVKNAKAEFNKLDLALLSLDTPSELVPFRRKNAIPSTVSFDEIYTLAQRRRSVRWFLDLPVPRELIDKSISVARLHPSDCNRSNCEAIIIDDPNTVTAVAEIPPGTKGFASNIPVIVAIVGNFDFTGSEKDRHSVYINTGLLSMSLMLALETLGLSSCPINWPDVSKNDQQLNKILNLKNYQKTTMLMAIGYADPEGYIPYSAKKETGYIRSYL